MVSEDRPHEISLPESTFYVLRDDATGKMHICEPTWSYDLNDPARADQLAVLQGYLNTPAQQVPAARMKILTSVVMQTIGSN